MPHPRDLILVALDVDNVERAHELVDQLTGHVGGFKIGKELFVTAGPSVVRHVVESGSRVFLDLKFHDIPNTVAGAVRAAVRHGVWMVNIHAAGGGAMCRAAVEAAHQAAEETGHEMPLIIGVTILTSLDDRDLQDVGLSQPAHTAALRLAKLSQINGLHGVVASAEDARLIKGHCGPDFIVVSPGIRPAGSDADDQKRLMTPTKAVANGSDYLVIGRPITKAHDPVEAAQRIVDEIKAAQKG
ncbi:MAG: orotidine-5'-phosphate decarboxylase [Alphaproteobacteria bacterium]